MKNSDVLEKLSKEELIKLIEIYSKNWLAMDGVWFQSVEKKLGMDEAMYHDNEAWKRFTVTEARRLKKFLGLEQRAGLIGLKKALELRFYANINDDQIIIEGNKLIYRANNCLVQSKRSEKGMEFHPCKNVGLTEYSGFAKEIDDRITCRCVSCYPEITDDTCACCWEFTLEE